MDEFHDVKIATPRCDVSDEQALVCTLEEYTKMPSFQGCVQASMVLEVCEKPDSCHKEPRAADY